MPKIVVTSNLKPWIDGEPRDKGFTAEVDKDLAEHLVKHDHAIELAEGNIPVIEPAAPAKGKA
jgi:hypothetical protein